MCVGLLQNNFCPTCRSRAVFRNVIVVPSPDSVTNFEDSEDEVDDDVTSLESESEESYFDDDLFLMGDSMSDQSEEEDGVINLEDLEDGDVDLEVEDGDIEEEEEDGEVEEAEGDTEEENEDSEPDDLSNLIEMEDNVEESGFMSDDSLFYEAETSSIFFSDDGEVD